MISERKKYLIKLFLKRCTLQGSHKSHMEFAFSLFVNTYPNVPPDKIAELKKRYNIEQYIERLIPIIDEQFTEEELSGAIKFYSSEIGKKIMDPVFLQEKVGKTGAKMFEEIEQEFAILHAKNTEN